MILKNDSKYFFKDKKNQKQNDSKNCFNNCYQQMVKQNGSTKSVARSIRAVSICILIPYPIFTFFFFCKSIHSIPFTV